MGNIFVFITWVISHHGQPKMASAGLMPADSRYQSNSDLSAHELSNKVVNNKIKTGCTPPPLGPSCFYCQFIASGFMLYSFYLCQTWKYSSTWSQYKLWDGACTSRVPCVAACTDRSSVLSDNCVETLGDINFESHLLNSSKDDRLFHTPHNVKSDICCQYLFSPKGKQYLQLTPEILI